MTFCKKAVILLLSVLSVIAKPTENIERMLLRKRLNTGNAASYVYRSDNNGPLQIYYLTSDDLNRKLHQHAPIYHQKPAAYHYKETPIASAYPISYYPPKTHIQPLGKLEVSIPVKTEIKTYPLNNHYPHYPPKPYSQKFNTIDMPIAVRAGPRPPVSDESNSHSSSASDESNSHSDESDDSGHDSHDNSHSNESKGFATERGQAHEEKYHKKKGHKSNNGYDNQFKFKTGKQGSYGNKHNSENEEEEGGKKDSHYDDADHHAKHGAEGKHKEGGDFEAKKHHNKGSKSKGYHNVFMKDEYKKDHTFYDEADHRGHYDKNGSDHQQHYSKEGAHEAGAHSDKAHYEDHNSEKDETQEGNYDHEHEEHKNKSGHENNYAHHENYDRKGETEGEGEHGKDEAHKEKDDN